ncbi:DUF2272 domain-containing protein [Rhodopila sp.]|uniref:DUF2272 domain-containing protein n=1 Tax=Rhodopila sp. TaxID=2480087 RepID=UPI003D1224D0
MHRLSILSLVLLAACTRGPMPDAHVPPFASVPFEPFSRQAVVAIALREWRLFGQRVANPDAEAGRTIKPEREPGLWQRVGEYWWLGLDPGSKESAWTGKHDGQGAVFPPELDGDYAWSAAFVSYVMRIAGAGQRFPYSADHADYINAARRVSLGQTKAWLIAAEPVQDYAPRPGDLVCFGRGPARQLRYQDLPTPALFPSHCDIVVDTTVPGQIAVIGGNVEDSVTLNRVPVTQDGKLATPQGVVLDPRFPWMTVLRLLADEPGPVA